MSDKLTLDQELIAQAKGLKREELDAFRKALRSGPKTFGELCDKLNLPPKTTRKYIEAAKAAGIEVQINGDHVAIQMPSTTAEIQYTGISPVVGETQRVAVISDTHLGSKYCMREQLRDFIEYAYEQGIRDILHPGDVLDGIYDHGRFELTHHGLEDQARDAAEVYPQLPGLMYHFITGNHDETFWNKTGVNVGRCIVDAFKALGREDIVYYGDRSAFLDIKGVTIELWHPRGGGAYARSYNIQKKIEGYTSIKPQILLIGHYHQYCHVFERGIQGIMCPTFQGSGSKFGKSLKGGQAQGGLILEWDLTEHGSIRNFAVKPRFYYEKETPVQIYNALDAQEIEPVVTSSDAKADVTK